MTTTILIDEKALRRRLDNVYSAMQTSAKPKFFKNGRRKGQLRIPGLNALPFTRQQLWDHVVAQLGYGAARCPYCEAIGRNANMITLANCVLDHKVPKVHAGHDMSLVQVWSLPNIVAVCADCNTLKGSATYAFFIGIMAALEAWEDPRDRTYIYKCLRTHGRVMQGYRGTNRRPPELEDRIGESGMLALQEDF